MAGELSSELLNQQLNDVRIDKDNILERLQIAETARFELQKMVTTLKEKHDEHVTSMEEKFEDSKVSTRSKDSQKRITYSSTRKTSRRNFTKYATLK